MRLPVYAPDTFWRATPEQIKKVCNGCGSEDGLKVPDTFWGLCVVLACYIHDWMFEEGETLGDYFFANAMFFWNLTAIVINNSNWFMMLLRMERALKYFLGVMFEKGQEAFWKNKEPNDAIYITYQGSLRVEFQIKTGGVLG
ncbi:MAG TPA: hypothetical protein CFH84_02705 [Sulfurimonas sp. UBA12504]|nr:MAG TPA: hypothetical protein CFH84_02705 [Sulfurimonas sp. UBA12504]